MEKKKSLEDLRRMNAEMEHESDPSKAFKESQRKKEYMEVFNLIFNRENEHPEWVKLGDHTMLSDVEERRKTILRNLHAMRRIFMGRDRSFRPFVVGKDGKLSDKKVAFFIKELILCYPESDSLSENKKKLLERFFYCVIVGPSVVYSKVHPRILMTEYAIPETFNEFIKAAKDPLFTYRNRLKAVREEERDRLYPEYADGFSFLMNQVYETLSEKSSRDLYTDEELFVAADEYADVLGLDTEEVVKAFHSKEEKTEGTDKPTETLSEESEREENESADPVILPCGIRLNPDSTVSLDAYLEEEQEEYPDEEKWEEECITLPEPNWDVLEEEENWYIECCFHAWEKYSAGLPKKNRFVQYYEELRLLLREVEPFDLQSLTEEMIDRYLVKKKLSPLWDDDEYAIISELMEKFIEVMEQWI